MSTRITTNANANANAGRGFAMALTGMCWIASVINVLKFSTLIIETGTNTTIIGEALMRLAFLNCSSVVFIATLIIALRRR